MPTASRPRALRGQVLVLLAVGSLLLIGFLAVAVDIGYLLSQRRGVQNAADAGALAAAFAIYKGETNTTVLNNTVAYYAQQNGYTVVPNVVLDLPGKKVTVDVTYDVPKFFLGAVYSGPWRTSAHAVAKLEPEPFDAALLALNQNGGGINSSGSTYIKVTGGSVMSNWKIVTGGSTTILADQQVNANKGFQTSGSTTLRGGAGENPGAPVVPDPYLNKLAAPVLPAFPANPIPNLAGSPQDCKEYPRPWNENIYIVPAGTYSGGGGNCLRIQNVQSGKTLHLTSGNYQFNGGGISIGGGNSGPIVLDGGNYTFNGGPGISVGGSTPDFIMKSGKYAFLNGARLSIGGSANGNVIEGGTYYFSGANSGILPGGSNDVTINPGTYIFDGGKGMNFSGSSHLAFNAGEYEFWFRDGADLSFSGSSQIVLNGDVHVKMYFYNGSSLNMSGSTSFAVPSGEYYFDGETTNKCEFNNSGSTLIRGEKVFLYFGVGCSLQSSGSASFGFTAPTTEVYPGYAPGIFMYSDRANTKQFSWSGSTTAISKGVIYLPSSPLKMSGASSGKVFEGQIIADRFILSGSNSTNLQYVEYVETSIPAVYLIE